MTSDATHDVLAPLAVRAAPPATLDLPDVAGLSWRPLTAADAQRLFTLIAAVETADEIKHRSSLEEITDQLGAPWVDLPQDSVAACDAEGVMRAYGVVEVRPGDIRTLRAFVRGGVHPDWRGRGLGRGLVRWLAGRGRQRLAASGTSLPARVATFVQGSAAADRAVYADAGFTVVRWFADMRRDLSLPLPEATRPAGVRIVPWTDALDEPVRLAHNEAFADHWGSEPHTAETWRHDSHFVPEWSFVALDDGVTGAPDADGRGAPSEGVTGSPDADVAGAPDARPQIAGYLVSGRYEQDWAPLGFSNGYTELLGVRRAWRGRGIARALLVTAMEAYRRDGMEYACLGVDTANPTGAHGLYARLGYTPDDEQVMYSIEL